MAWKPPATDIETTGWTPPNSDMENQVQNQPQPDMSGSFPEARAVLSSDASIPQKAWDMAQVPSQMASRGLHSIASAVPNPEPTGNLPMDLIRGTPRIAADTLAQAAPGFVSRASLLTGMASNALPKVGSALAPIGKWAAGVAEDWSGVKPGTLVNAANDASLFFAKGKESASPLYEEGKTGGKMASQLRGIPMKDDFLDVSSKLADEGKLPPETALEARKLAGKLLSKGGGKYTPDYLRDLVNKFDDIAKSNDSLAAGDAAYQRGIQAQSMRKLFPSNVGGRASPMKTAEAGWIAKTLGAPGKILALGTSPLIQGITATAGGLAGRIGSNPEAAMALQNAYASFIDKYTTKENSQ